MMVSDEEMEEYIKAGNLTAIVVASKRDPSLITRGWRNGTLPWINFAMGRESYKTIVPKLLELGADINLSTGGLPYEDAISSAVNSCELEKLKFLLEHGAKPSKRHAVWNAVVAPRRQLEMVKLLDKYGADIHEVDEGGFSGRYANPLSLAKDYDLHEVVAYLESRGCVMPPSDDWEPGEVVESSNTQTQQIIEHFTRTIGAPEQLSLIQIVPTGIPVAVHAIPANEHHPYVTLFTTGMSEQPMTVPDGAEEYSRVELYIQLPADWKYRDYEDPNWGWPQHWLRSMAQYPQQHDTWLGGPVTLVANEEPPQPLAPNTKFTTLLLLADQSLVTDDGKKIWLYRMTPLYTEERQLEIEHGIPALLNAFDAHDIPMIVDMNRKNVGLQ
jgi:hypothetical protein